MVLSLDESLGRYLFDDLADWQSGYGKIEKWENGSQTFIKDIGCPFLYVY
jgi:hypothetical protein